MKKLAALAVVAVLATSLAGGSLALASEQEPADAQAPAAQEADVEELNLSEGRDEAYSHTIVVKEGRDLTVCDVYFEDILYVEVPANSSVTFVNCGFERGIDYMGSPTGRLVIADGCQFAPDTFVWLMYTTESATVNDPFPRVMSMGVPFEVAGDEHSVVTYLVLMQDFAVFNGETYTIDGCTVALDAQTDEFLEFDPQAEYNSIGICTWWENGEQTILAFATEV